MEKSNTTTSFEKLKPIEIMLALLFLVAPFYYHDHIGGMGLRIPNNIMVWLVANVIGWYSLYLFSKRAKLSLPKYFRYIIAFPILATISGFITGVDNPIDWLFRLLFIWYGLLFFVGLFQHNLTQGRVDRILFVIVVSALIQALVGIIQMRFSGLIPTWFPDSQWSIPYGMFQQINNQAIYQVTSLIAAVFLITRPYINKGHVWKRIIILIFFAMSAFIISYSGSRVGALAVLISLPFAIKGRWKLLVKNKRLAIASIIFVMIGGVIGGGGFIKVSDKLTGISNGYSSSARLGIYAVSLDLIKEKPLFGHGIGNFKYKWQYEKADFYQSHPEAHLIDDYVTHPHNEILFWAVESGVVAVVGILIVLLGIAVSLRGKNKHRMGMYLALMIPILLHTQVELPFYSSAIHWFLALFLLFVVMRFNTQTKLVKLSNAAMKSLSILSMVMLSLGTVFLVHTQVSNYELGDKSRGVWNVPAAAVNPYFSQIVEAVQMKSLLQLAMKNNVPEEVDRFAYWAEDYLPKEPSSQMFVFLAMAYQYLDKKDEMCRTMRVGQSIYPYNEDLVSGLVHCNK